MGETKQRSVVLDIINSTHGHLTAEDIYQRAASAYPAISRSTVYRNLGILTDRGVIAQVNAPGKATYFDRNPEPHSHIICPRCGAIEDLPLESNAISSLVPPDTDVLSYSLIINSLCADCR
ncbi:MAG: transcriptional repressor [Coriobacteriales bacterium]|jgi:Fur family peroxide stress response transcriptional regulator|nr:transcriptional repressor [Coriobacteriales bacterium]